MSASPPTAPQQQTVPPLEISSSRHFVSWLAEQNISIAFTTYQAGKLFFLGAGANGQIAVFERTFDRSMGLHCDGNGLVMSTRFQIWHLENALTAGEMHQEYDRLYVPRLSYTTGDLDVHDVAVDGGGRVLFVNTLFSCLATVSRRHNFIPLWKPPFITRLAAEDRCHLNGLALAEGKPRYLTAVAASDVADGWRDQRRNGGIVMDISNGATIAGGLSMPHSPRLYRGQLWLHDTGNGYFGRLDPRDGRFERVAFGPGYLRGMDFAGDFAIVGLSRPRGNKTFEGLALEAELTARGAAARCGLLVIDLRSGDAVHWVRLDGVIEELYDVVALPGVRRPMALGFKTDEIQRTITIGDAQAL